MAVRLAAALARNRFLSLLYSYLASQGFAIQLGAVGPLVKETGKLSAGKEDGEEAPFRKSLDTMLKSVPHYERINSNHAVGFQLEMQSQDLGCMQSMGKLCGPRNMTATKWRDKKRTCLFVAWRSAAPSLLLMPRGQGMGYVTGDFESHFVRLEMLFAQGISAVGGSAFG